MHAEYKKKSIPQCFIHWQFILFPLFIPVLRLHLFYLLLTFIINNYFSKIHELRWWDEWESIKIFAPKKRLLMKFIFSKNVNSFLFLIRICPTDISHQHHCILCDEPFIIYYCIKSIDHVWHASLNNFITSIKQVFLKCCYIKLFI